MKYSTVGENNMVGALGPTYASLHTDIPDQSGSNEVAGGSPAYARQPVTLTGASGGGDSFSNQPVFDVPTGTTVFFIGLWDDVAAGNFLGCMPINGGAVTGAGTGATSDLITSYAHGLTTDDRVTLEEVAGAALPTGLDNTTIYFVLAAGLTADAFKLSLTSGGAAIDITAASQLVFTKVVPQAYASQGTLTVNSGAYDLLG